MSRLIILRGNSGSGKSTIALRLQRELGYGTMLIQQDVTRRETLRVKGDEPGNPNVQFMANMALYGRKIGYDVIIEGILQNTTNQDMLLGLISQFDEAYAYYFDIPFEETLKRHATKPKATEFGETQMRDWWREKDYLGTSSEVLIGPELSEDEILDLVLTPLRHE